MVLFLLLLSLLTGCYETGYQNPYIISHTEDSDSEVASELEESNSESDSDLYL